MNQLMYPLMAFSIAAMAFTPVYAQTSVSEPTNAQKRVACEKEVKETYKAEVEACKMEHKNNKPLLELCLKQAKDKRTAGIKQCSIDFPRRSMGPVDEISAEQEVLMELRIF